MDLYRTGLAFPRLFYEPSAYLFVVSHTRHYRFIPGGRQQYRVFGLSTPAPSLGLVVATPHKALQEARLKKGVFLLGVIVTMLLIAFCFFASSICIVVVLASFTAILADPAVQFLERFRFPRYLAATVVVLAGAVALSLVAYGSYIKLSNLSNNVGTYAERIRELISPINKRIQHVRDSAGLVIHETAPQQVPELRIRESTPWATYLARGVGSMGGAVMIAAVLPFLVFFMLIVREKLYVSFKAIAGSRLDVDLFLTKIKNLVLGYVIGNVLVGSFLAAVSVLIFWQSGLKSALTLGIVSGVLNLIPFLGLVLALVVPLVAGLVQFHSTTQFVIVIAGVTILHLIAANLLLPRFVGSRLDVGPVAATIGLLFFGWLWGIPGIFLAVPLTAVLKVLADSDPGMAHFSNLLARNPRRFLRRRTPRVSDLESAVEAEASQLDVRPCQDRNPLRPHG